MQLHFSVSNLILPLFLSLKILSAPLLKRMDSVIKSSVFSLSIEVLLSLFSNHPKYHLGKCKRFFIWSLLLVCPVLVRKSLSTACSN